MIDSKFVINCNQNLYEIPYTFKSDFYREIGCKDIPIITTCTLQGSSVTQGNPVTFTAKTFAV